MAETPQKLVRDRKQVNDHGTHQIQIMGDENPLGDVSPPGTKLNSAAAAEFHETANFAN